MKDVWRLVGVLKWKNERVRVARSKAAFEAAVRGQEAKNRGRRRRK